MVNKPRKPLKVRVTIDIEVDRDAYDSEYNEFATAEEIRAHIKGSAVTAVESDFRLIRAIKVKSFR